MVFLDPNLRIVSSEDMSGPKNEITIGENGNWFINGDDTGIKAKTALTA